jgi:Enolase, C-terminal TIM barrel domain
MLWQAAGYSGKVKIGMDVAASEFLTDNGKYDLNFKNKPNDGSEVKTGCANGSLMQFPFMIHGSLNSAVAADLVWRVHSYGDSCNSLQ